MINILIGTRAQLIKMAPVLLALEHEGCSYRLVLSGQHQATMAELLAEFGVATAPVVLHAGREITGIAQMARWFLHMLWRAGTQHHRYFIGAGSGRDCMVVHGDTVSTLLGALLARLRGLAVVHVESGLTSGRWREPFPEELTRRLVFRLADLAFCPGEWAAGNMRRFRARVVDTGTNTIVDAVNAALSRIAATFAAAPATPYAVVSLHRFENIFEAARFTFIVETLERIAARVPLVFVLHPATRKQAEKFGLFTRLAGNPRIRLEPRMTYVPFLGLLHGARFVISDGGSNQEELAWLGIPTLLMRGTTERRDGLGETVVVSDYDSAIIERFVTSALAEDGPRAVRTLVDSPSRLIARQLAADYG